MPVINRDPATPDKANAVFQAGLNLPLRDNQPDYPALALGNYLLGGASDARLSQRIREQEGLSYSVRSWLSACHASFTHSSGQRSPGAIKDTSTCSAAYALPP